MKKHEVVLDFTSLLDVILIILFLVLCTMNGKAQKDNDRIDELAQANATQAAQIAGMEEEIEDLTGKKDELQAETDRLQAALDEIKKEYDRLYAENQKNEADKDTAQALLDKYMQISGLDKNDSAAYDFFKQNVVYLELEIIKVEKTICSIELSQNGQHIGTPLLINPDPKAVVKNTTIVSAWLSPLLNEQASSGAANKVVLLTIRYRNTPDEYGVLESAITPVKEALSGLEKSKTKGYSLFTTEIQDNNIE